MNTEHAESLSLYLRHYSNLSATAAENPKLVDMSYSSLTIESADGTPHEIPIEPQMQAWSDARPRVVAMERDARAALGLPPLEAAADEHDSAAASAGAPAKVAVTAYDAPTAPFHVFMIGLVVFFFGGYFARRSGHWLVPGAWYWENVMVYFPLGGAEGYAWLQDKLGVPVVLLHGAETLWMVGKLRAHKVRMGTGLWWKWVGATFLEGFGAHQRFHAVVRRGGGVKSREQARSS
jgi:Protein of unknown function (DUF2470)